MCVVDGRESESVLMQFSFIDGIWFYCGRVQGRIEIIDYFDSENKKKLTFKPYAPFHSHILTLPRISVRYNNSEKILDVQERFGLFKMLEHI